MELFSNRKINNKRKKTSKINKQLQNERTEITSQETTEGKMPYVRRTEKRHGERIRQHTING